MKIAVVTEDKETISQHFGRAPYYLVFTVEDGKITGKEIRDKAGHHTFAASGDHHHESTPGERHGFDAGAQSRHATMAEAISDCQVLISGGMGHGAFEGLKSFNIEPFITDERSAEEAVTRYVKGDLPNLKDRLH